MRQEWSTIVAQALIQFKECADENIAQQISIQWNPRMRSAAGRAFYRECRIELNPRLLLIGLDECRRTLLHELAHVLAYYRYQGRRIAPHGLEWQQACSDLGIAGERATHKLALPTRKQKKKWRYRCPSCEYRFECVRALKHPSACRLCCKKWNGGVYHKKFQFIAEKVV